MSVAYYELLCQEDIDRGVDVVTKRNPAGGTQAGTQVGLHSFAVGGAAGSATWDPGAVSVGGEVSTAVTVNGAALGDFALASFSLDLAGLTLSAYVSAANTVTVVLSNLTSGAVNLSSGALRVIVFATR